MRKDVLISLLSVKGVMYERMERRIGCDPPKYIHNPIFNLKNRSIFFKKLNAHVRRPIGFIVVGENVFFA